MKTKQCYENHFQCNDKWCRYEKTYTVHDVQKAGFTLEPLKCLHCNRIGEVDYNQYLKDGLCGYCGKWQIEDSK